MFEKTFKVFAATLACTNPVEPRFTQDFLLDTGAGRNLISFKGMPDILKEHVTEAPEKVRFATGGGPRPGLKAINLQGSSSGNSTFYALIDCPAARSVGIQVNEHRRPFVWMPDQLPFMVKTDRVGEMVMHVPESAKIYQSNLKTTKRNLFEKKKSFPEIVFFLRVLRVSPGIPFLVRFFFSWSGFSFLFTVFY